jgi:hypothetical protein
MLMDVFQKKPELLFAESEQDTCLGSPFLASPVCHFRLWVAEAEFDPFFDRWQNRLPDVLVYSHDVGCAAFGFLARACNHRNQVSTDALGSQKRKGSKHNTDDARTDLSDSNHLRKVGRDRMVAPGLMSRFQG